MNILEIDCKTIVTAAQVLLKMQSVKIVFDSKKIATERFLQGKDLIYFLVMDETEEERYERKYDKSSYKAKSPSIHIPDFTVDELLDVFKEDVTGAYDRTCHYLETVQMKSECPIELKFVLYIFLHEVGHWEQLKRVDGYVSKYIEDGIELAKENYEKSALLYQKIKENNLNLKDGEKPWISKSDMQELIRLEEEYRQIPKEADADNYAKKIMEEMDIEKMMREICG